MNMDEEIIVYDAFRLIQTHSKLLNELVKKYGGNEHRKAYRDGIYRPAVKLGVALGRSALERGKERYKQFEHAEVLR